MLAQDERVSAGDRAGRQQAPSTGVTDLANFGLAASAGDIAASAGFSLALGVALAPDTGLALDIGGGAVLTHSMDAPVLADHATLNMTQLATGTSLTVTPLALPGIPEVVETDNSSPAPSASVPQAHAEPVIMPEHGSGTSPDILQPPATTSDIGDAVDTIRDSTVELAGAIGSLVNLLTPVQTGVTDAAVHALDAARGDLATIAQSVAAISSAQLDTLTPLVDQVQDSAATTVSAVTDSVEDITGEVPALVGATGDVVQDTLAGIDPVAGLATLHQLLDAESAFELTNPATGDVVFSSVTAPVVEALDPVGDVALPIGDTLADTVTTVLPLDDHHDHGLGHTLGGLFDHG